MKTNNEQLIYALALNDIKGIGAISTRKLIEEFGSPEMIFKEKPQRLALIPRIGAILSEQIGNKSLFEKAEKEIAFIEKHQIEMLYFNDPNFPYRLNECHDAPAILFYKGVADLNSKRIISIVGTRSATQYGKDLIEDLMKELALADPSIIVVSGLAYGIDICAHRSALKHQLQTIGTLAHGLDRIYPETHRETAKGMLSNGGLLTEYVSNTTPEKGNFIARNRIVAGLSDATILVETADKGGSIVTANIADSYNREVFAFPGRVSDKYSQGCNRLIRQNRAALISSANDLLDMMNWKVERKLMEAVQPTLFFELSHNEQRVYQYIVENGQVQINKIGIDTEIPINELTGILLELEFRELIRAYPGGVYRLR